jgi:hypothetical protein
MAKQNRVTYERVIAILEDLAYTPDEDRSAEDHVTFTHPGRDGLILLPVLKSKTPMHAMHLAMIAKVLSDASHDDAETFKARIKSEGSRDTKSVPV